MIGLHDTRGSAAIFYWIFALAVLIFLVISCFIMPMPMFIMNRCNLKGLFVNNLKKFYQRLPCILSVYINYAVLLL